MICSTWLIPRVSFFPCPPFDKQHYGALNVLLLLNLFSCFFFHFCFWIIFLFASNYYYRKWSAQQRQIWLNGFAYEDAILHRIANKFRQLKRWKIELKCCSILQHRRCCSYNILAYGHTHSALTNTLYSIYIFDVILGEYTFI